MEVNMNRKGIGIVILLTSILLVGCTTNTLYSGAFTNTTPAQINMNDTLYFMTEEVVSKNDIEKQIGKITRVSVIVSYLETDDPYKNPNKIFKINDKDIKDVIGIEVNGKVYEATTKKDF